MNKETTSLLLAYKDQLNDIAVAEDVFNKLSTWSFNNRSEVAKVVKDLNESLCLRESAVFRDHILTTAVGDLSGLLFVSANPGWSASKNAKEDRFRSSDVNNNYKFCVDFFRTFRTEVGANAWWSRALSLSHMVITRNISPVSPKTRWDWAQNGVAVGNIDLIPFHSTADKFGLLSSSSPASKVMRSIATSTLEMALRIKPTPRLIFVGSALGAPIADKLCEELGMHFWSAPSTGVRQFDRLRRYVHPETGSKVMTFPYQPFAGFASKNLPPGFMSPLATLILEFANPSQDSDAAHYP
jgi:hypothetical protein